jgi:hypothetical protein
MATSGGWVMRVAGSGASTAAGAGAAAAADCVSPPRV